ncbi:MAG TPA: outer membrane protein assembly factor BamD [Candidatus Hydrogenedentes bacterium]|nr:outer membrane protein assembly factor BamD [Candidatus Hydrogenedentota bacterium]
MVRWHRTLTWLLIAVFAAGAAHAQWTWTPQTKRFINLKKLPKETPELQIEHARSLMMKKQFKEAWRETQKFSEAYSDSELADQNQYLRGEIKMRQGKWMDASKEFQRVLSAYPETALYEDAIKKQYEIGDHYYGKGVKNQKHWWNPLRKRSYKKAIKVYSMVIENQPFTMTAAEAQYKLGLCHFARKEYLEASFEYQRVIEDYKDSAWVDKAYYDIAMCYYKGSLDADYDQTPSELAVRSIDDFSARYPNDERNADLLKKRQEMRNRIAEQRLIVAQFHEKRREFDSARIYYDLLTTQYNDTPCGKTAQEWLDKHPKVETESRAEITKLRNIQ